MRTLTDLLLRVHTEIRQILPCVVADLETIERRLYAENKDVKKMLKGAISAIMLLGRGSPFGKKGGGLMGSSGRKNQDGEGMIEDDVRISEDVEVGLGHLYKEDGGLKSAVAKGMRKQRWAMRVFFNNVTFLLQFLSTKSFPTTTPRRQRKTTPRRQKSSTPWSCCRKLISCPQFFLGHDYAGSGF